MQYRGQILALAHRPNKGRATRRDALEALLRVYILIAVLDLPLMEIERATEKGRALEQLQPPPAATSASHVVEGR